MPNISGTIPLDTKIGGEVDCFSGGRVSFYTANITYSQAQLNLVAHPAV
ncbi:MAG: hypothetical protein AAFO95_05760 [Cyanobacteria bacterium J06600_6]